MSKADIARAEGTDASSVRKSINRGLHQLKKYFEKFSLPRPFLTEKCTE